MNNDATQLCNSQSHHEDAWSATNFTHPQSAIGAMSLLMMYSEYHKSWNAHDINIEIIPPLTRGQYRIYHTEQGDPVGFVTWACVNEEVKNTLIQRQRPIQWTDWNSGPLLMFNDFVAPFGHARWMISDLRSTLFAEAEAFSLRRATDGQVKKINRWEGKFYRQKLQPELAPASTDLPYLGAVVPKAHAEV